MIVCSARDTPFHLMRVRLFNFVVVSNYHCVEFFHLLERGPGYGGAGVWGMG
ncbi:hypothetical protein HanIR_Chr16g0839711 [Helianthus annuus]|nr:hypothetical protein HanIR_Chr16g0839711 [Helianthus annuus]